ncbi:MAG: amino acid ABC transporter permease [Clostridia bacterium]|nr:amino acid ABC transporter permease [Clostridia bacterium]
MEFLDIAGYICSILPYLLEGTLTTLRLFALTLVIALPLGLIISMGSISKSIFLRGISSTYVWIFRGTPLLLQLFFVYYGLPYIQIPLLCPDGIVLDRFPAAVVTFVLNYAAYFAEIYRAGIQSIDRGQHEAAKVLGYTYGQKMTKIIIPQTLRRILPPITNETITLIKDTALVASISVAELLKAAKDVVNRDVNVMAFAVAAAIYLLLTLVLTKLLVSLERKFIY